MMHKGRTVLYGDVMKTRAKYRKNSIRVSVEGEIGALSGVAKMTKKNGAIELLLDPDISSQMILDQLIKNKVVINHFEVITPQLRDIFLEEVGGNNE